MNAKERVEAALRIEEPDDRVPVTIFGSASPYHMAGINFEEAMFRPDLVVKCTEKWQEIFPENDIILPMAPGQMVAAWKAMGAEAKVLSTGWFDVTKPGVKSREELEKLDFDEVLEKFLESKMFTTAVEAIETISEKYSDEFLIGTAWELGFTFAGRVIGTEEEMLLLKDDPELVHELARWGNKMWIEAAEELIDAGVDITMTPDPNSMTALISPETYKEFAWPLQKEMAEAVKEMGAYHHPHICGDAEPLLEYVAETGCDMFSFDQRTRISEAKEKIGDEVTLLGNVDPGRILRGTPEEVRKLSEECIRIAGPGGGFVLGPGCDTAKLTPKENFRAMCDAAKEKGKYPIA